MPLQGCAYVDGRYVAPEDAKISIFDWGFLHSDATYDVAHVWQGSFFRLDDNLKIEWQRDFFDFGHVSNMFGKLIQSGDLSAGMQKRIERAVAGEKLPGYYPLGQAPVAIW